MVHWDRCVVEQCSVPSKDMQPSPACVRRSGTRIGVIVLFVALLVSMSTVIGTPTAVAQAADDYPEPALLIDPTPIEVGQPLIVTTNEYRGTSDGNEPGDGMFIHQCRTGIDAGYPHCVRLGYFEPDHYLEPFEVVPVRMLIVKKELFDCASGPNVCSLDLINTDLRVDVPFSFVDPGKPPLPQQLRVRKTQELDDLEPVVAKIRASLEGDVTVWQCIRKRGQRQSHCVPLYAISVTNDLRERLTIRPQRGVVTPNGRVLDCAKANQSCYLKASNEYGIQVGKRIPITFATEGRITMPRIRVPKAPFESGQKVTIRLSKLTPGSTVIARCSWRIPNGICGRKVRATADENGRAEVTLKVGNTYGDCISDLPWRYRPCSVLVTTEPETIAVRVPISFHR